MNKVIDDNDFGLCGNCIFHKTTKFYGKNKSFRSCNKLDIQLNGPVEKCSYFFDIKYTRLDDFKEIAWELDMRKKEKIGFTPPVPGREKRYLEDPLTSYKD